MRTWLPAVALLVACSGGIAEDITVPDDPIVEPDDSWVYDLDHVLEVEITLPEDEWDALRFQARPFGGLWAGEDCMDQPFESPYTWFEAEVTVDGTPMSNVGIRKKGFFGSVEPERPSLKLDFNRNVADQQWETVTRLTLNNNRQDDTRIATCMGYALFDDAGRPAARCNFAHVTVNGRDMGIYSNVEPVKKPMLRRAFGSDTGSIFEGTISDFRDGWIGTFESKTAESDPAVLDGVAEAVAAPDDQLVDALDAVINLDEFIDFWVMESMIGHWDGYAGNRNNYFVYADPDDGGRLRFVPWGVDAILSGDRPFGFGDPTHPVSVVATGAITYRAIRHPVLQQRFVDQMRLRLDELWDEDALDARRQRMVDLIADLRLPNQGYGQAMSAMERFLDTRQQRVEDELDAGWRTLPGTWPEYNNCQVELASFVADFETTWSSTTEGAPWTRGTGSITMTEQGEDVSVEFLGTTAGPWRTDQIIAISGRLPTGGEIMLIATAQNDRALFETGEHPASDFNLIMTQDDDGGHDSYRFVGSLTGTVTLDQVSETPGETLAGTLEAAVFGRRQ